MCAFYCVAFTECMLSGKTLLDYINLFSPNEYNMNNKIIYKYFKDKYVKSQVQIKKAYKTRQNYLFEELNHNDLISKKLKKACKYSNYVQQYGLAAKKNIISLKSFQAEVAKLDINKLSNGPTSLQLVQ